MTVMILLSDAQMVRISPFFPLTHGIHRVDEKLVISGIIFVIRNGLRFKMPFLVQMISARATLCSSLSKALGSPLRSR